MASFAVWVWSTKGSSTGVTVQARVAWAEYIGAPSFTVCPVPDGTSCKVGNLPAGQADELQVAVKVKAKAALGEQVELFAKAAAKGALSFQGSATDVVVVAPTVSPTVPAITLPPVSLPPIAGTGTTPGNPIGLFPTVQSGASPTPSSLGLPRVKRHATLRAADAAATVPIDTRLIGGQLAGLAVLAGAVAIAIARLSLRAPKPQDDGAKRPPEKS